MLMSHCFFKKIESVAEYRYCNAPFIVDEGLGTRDYSDYGLGQFCSNDVFLTFCLFVGKEIVLQDFAASTKVIPTLVFDENYKFSQGLFLSFVPMMIYS